MSTPAKKPASKRAAKKTKGEVVQLRVTTDLKNEMVALADAEGMTLSTWIRSVAIRAVRAQKAAPQS